jgi:hypothetical protein
MKPGFGSELGNPQQLLLVAAPNYLSPPVFIGCDSMSAPDDRVNEEHS